MINKLVLVVTIGVLSLVGCGGSSSSGGLDIQEYDLEAYSGRSLSVSGENLEGTWVGVSNYTIQTNSEITSLQIGTSFKAFIIKKDGDDYSVGDCYGDYEAASVSNEIFNVGSNSFKLKSNKKFIYEFSRTLDRGYFTEDHDIKQSYIKISDSINAIGAYVRNWSDIDGENRSDVTCAYTAKSNGTNSDGVRFNKETFRVGSEDGHATIRLGAGYNEYDAYIEGSELENYFSLIYSGDKVALSIGGVDSSGFNANFNAYNSAGLSVVGRLAVQLPVE